MATYTNPTTITTGDLIGAAQMNSDWVENIKYLYDNRAQGNLGYAQVTANQTGITTEVDLTSLTVTVTVGSGRRIKITGSFLVDSTVAGDDALGRIYEGAAVLNAEVVRIPATSQGYGFHREVVLTPSAGSHTYKLRLGRQGGTGNISMLAAATFPAFILVEDIGL